MQESEDTRLLIRYLLGDLPGEQQDKIEERYAADDSFYFKLLATEDELIDSYVLGEISVNDREKFERAYISNPYRLKKVESNRSLLAAVTNMLSPAPWYQRFINSLQRTLVSERLSLRHSFATLLLIVALGGALTWLLWDRVRLRNELAQISSQWNQKENAYQREIAALTQGDNDAEAQPSPRVPDSLQEISPGRKDAKPNGLSPIVAFAVPRGIVRSWNAAPKPLVIRRGVTLARLIVDVQPNEYSEYKISLQKIRKIDELAWTRTLSKAQPGFSSRKIFFTVPADYFENQDYILKVSASNSQGEEILALSHFTVINKNLAPRNRK